ncbi:MAG: hypothetical protein U0V72_07915 [Cytophagales bacterium]
MKEFYKSDTALVYFDESLDTLFLKYYKKVNNDDHFLEINNALLKAFCSLNTNKVVADIRQMNMISVNAQKWIVTVLFPEMLKHLAGKPLIHAQLLNDKDIMSKVSALNVKNKAKNLVEGFEVFQFSDENELIDFLKDVK